MTLKYILGFDSPAQKIVSLGRLIFGGNTEGKLLISIVLFRMMIMCKTGSPW